MAEEKHILVTADSAAVTEDETGSNRASLKRLILPVYGPTFLAATAQQAVLPVLPLFLSDMGARCARI